jgi:large subunit ribosomal protein L10
MRSEKTHVVNFVGGLLKDSEFVYFVNYKGLTVKSFSEFRRQIAKNGAKCHVIKNTIIQKSAELSALPALAKCKLKDSTAMVVGKGDPSIVAKTIMDFNKTNAFLSAKGGYLEGAVLLDTDVKAIASLPSREVIYAQLLGLLQAPARNLVCVLNAKAASIINVLNSYKDKLEKSQA